MERPTENHLLTTKMPGENERQYTAFLLYHEIKSIRKVMEAWEKLGQSSGEMMADFAQKLGKKPTRATVERWSKKYQWVLRSDLKLTEELKELDEKLKKVRQKRAYLITELFWEKLKKIQKQMNSGEPATVQEIKILWEMHRTEFGESIGKHQIVGGIDESEQKPLTPEEEELSKEITKLEMEFNRKQLENKKDNDST